MVTILEQKPGLGQALGIGVGQGLSEGLKMLAASKAEGLHRQELMKGLEAAGLPPEVADLPEGFQKEIFKQKSREALLSRIFGPQSGGGGVAVDTMLTESGPQGSAAVLEESGPSTEELLALGVSDPSSAKLLQAERDYRLRERTARLAESRDYRKKLRQENDLARENIMRLDRMTELIDEGDLTNPVVYSVLNKFGLDFDVLLSPDTQEFRKLSNDFIRGAREIYGARVTNFELDAFLKTIPNLMQTEAGKRRVIRNLRILSEGKRARYQESRDILKEFKGIPPWNFEELVEERVAPKLDELSKRFVFGEPAEEKRIEVIGPNGGKYTLPAKQWKIAKKKGYKKA